MTITAKAKEIAERIWERHTSDDAWQALVLELRGELSKVQLESLAQLVKHGPVWDGDVVSKHTRDELLQLRIASRAIVKGKEGYTVANYIGGRVHNPWWAQVRPGEDTLLTTDLKALNDAELEERFAIEERDALAETLERPNRTRAEIQRREAARLQPTEAT